MLLGRIANKKTVIALLHELLKDSSRSDRELGKVIGVSQPTVSKTKKQLLEEGTIEGFTMIPNFPEIGYNLLALTFVKIKNILSSPGEHQKTTESIKDWLNKQPNVVFADYCRGMEVDAFMISFHESYQDFDKFINKHNQELGNQLKDVKNILVNLAGDETLKDFHFKYLASNMKQ